jgi:DNA-binding response OmpR family regulator
MRPNKLNVLFADDDPVLGQIVEAALHKAGYTVTIARDAMQAVMFAVRTPPDIMLLDITMPGGNGLLALQKLKTSDKTRHVPVIVISGIKDEALPAKVRQLGAEEFLPKPIDMEALPQHLHAIIDAARLVRERVLEAVRRLAIPDGTDAEAVRSLLASEHNAHHDVVAIEAMLEQLRSRRKVMKQQDRWFPA